MSWKIPLSTTTAIALNAGENLYVADGVNVFVTTNDAIQAASQSDIVIDGTVISQYFCIRVGTPGTQSSDISVTVTANGRIQSLDDSGIWMRGTGCVVSNAGTIVAEDWAITVDADDGGIATINNSGSMSGYRGIYAGTSETVVVDNSGTITGTDSAYFAGEGGPNVNLITNSGQINGLIEFGFGNDLYDGRLGHVNGAVKGFDGDDRIFGGSEDNLFYGENGDDQLWGGRGADTLTGGADADRFIFDATADSTVKTSGRDTITDFAHGIDEIDLQGMDANKRARGDQAFDFIGAQGFHHKAGELHIVKTAGNTVLQGDVNGDGKADFAITLAGQISLNNGDFAL